MNSGNNYFWSVKNSLDVLDKLRAFDGPFDSVDSFDLSTLYTTLPHYLIKQKFSYLIKWSFGKSECKYMCCNLLKPSPLMGKVNMLDVLTGGVMR